MREVTKRTPAVLPELPAEQRALLDAVLAAPDDDAPRLVYADWLAARADPRGEFIAVQCELARAEASAPALAPADPTRLETLRAREAELLAKHKKRWVGTFAGARRELELGARTYVSGSPTRWTFRRGFVDEVTMNGLDLARHAAALFSVEPVRRAHVSDKSVGAVLACEAMTRLRELDLSNHRLHESGARALARAKHLASLEALELRKCGLGVGATKTLAAATPAGFPRLTTLGLADNALRDAGASALASARFLATVTSLDLARNAIGATGLRALLASPHLARLRALELIGNPIGPDGVRALIERFPPSLRVLSLRATDVGDDGAEALARAPAADALERLELNHNEHWGDVTERGCALLRERFGARLVAD